MSGSFDDDRLPPPVAPVLDHDRIYEHGGNNAFHNFYNDYSHIPDPNLRRRLALSEIDKVPFGVHHVRAVLVAGAGFLLDSYDIFAINLITTLLGLVFWGGDEARDGAGGNRGRMPNTVNEALKAATSAGIILGMLVFGWLADAFGRRRMYGIELAIIIFGTLCCALAGPSPAISAAGLLIFWRVLMGFGIGGDYPLSSVIMSEFAPTRWRGAMMAAVFSMQGFGQLLAALVALITTVAFKDAYINIPNEGACDITCRAAADRAWRIIVGIGAVPACFALYYRITIPETPRYTFDVKHDVDKGDADIRAYVSSQSQKDLEASKRPCAIIGQPSLDVPKASLADVGSYFGQWKNSKVLLGTTLSWFFLGLAFYGLSLNSSVVLRVIGYADGDTLYHKLYNQAVGMIILAGAGSIPGYWVAVFSIDTVGRKPLQIIGFLLLAVVFCILGFTSHSFSETVLLALYVIIQFLFNAGPNTTTFVVPGECFPTRYRSTGHGISAAMGKIGAIVAQVISIPLLNKDSADKCKGSECYPNLGRLLQLFALFMLLGALASLLIPETKGLTLEELSGENPTSYNAGCNGSIHLATPKRRRWNPFSGGQPAGFSYLKSHSISLFAKGSRSSRVGAAEFPEFMSEDEPNKRRSRAWKKQGWQSRQMRMQSDGTDEIALSSCSRTHSSGQATARGDEFIPDAQSKSAGKAIQQHQQPQPQPQMQLPVWGAGWGRIDRGRPPPLMSSAQFQDVGSLLRQV